MTDPAEDLADALVTAALADDMAAMVLVFEGAPVDIVTMACADLAAQVAELLTIIHGGDAQALAAWQAGLARWHQEEDTP